MPVAFVLGTCVYHIAHRSMMQSLRQAYQRLTDEHKLPETSPKPTFTLGLDR